MITKVARENMSVRVYGRVKVSSLRRLTGDDLKNEDLVLLSITRKGMEGERVQESVAISLGELKSFMKDNRYREPITI